MVPWVNNKIKMMRKMNMTEKREIRIMPLHAQIQRGGDRGSGPPETSQKYRVS